MNKSISAAAALMGRKGGSKKSEAKTASSRLNPVGHGRPRLPDDQLTPNALYQRQRREKMKKEKETMSDNIKVEQRTDKGAGKIIIGFDDMTSDKAFYVFEQDGEAFVSNTGGGSWYGEITPTGKSLARFHSLKEAKAAYPTGKVTKEAKAAIESGMFE